MLGANLGLLLYVEVSVMNVINYLAAGTIMQQSIVILWAVDIDFPLCRTVGTFLWSKLSSQILTCNFEISLTDCCMELKAHQFI